MSLLASLPPHIRRRLSFDDLKKEFDDIMENIIFPKYSPNSSEYVADVADFMVQRFAEDNPKITFKDRDTLYYFFVDFFGDYIAEKYNKSSKKNKNINEEISRMLSMTITESDESVNEQDRVRKFSKSSQPLQDVIYQYLTKLFSNGKRTIGVKSRNYGNLSERWCVKGYEILFAAYYFEDGEFNKGTLLVSKELVSDIQKFFSVRQAYAKYIIEEWYDDIMVPEFEKNVGENNLTIDTIDTMSRTEVCVPEPVKPEGITDEEMIDFITKNTLYKKNDVIAKIESGERNLDDFYLDIVDTVNRRNIHGS